MAAREGVLVFKEELCAAKRTIMRENPEPPEGSSRHSNDPEPLTIVIEQDGSRETSSSALVSFSGRPEWFNSILKAGSESSSSGYNNNNNNNNLQGQGLGHKKIRKVPDLLRVIKSNQDCYDPILVSIGPYHHGKDSLEEMEKLKIKWACRLVTLINDKKLTALLEKLEKVADEARTYYYDTGDWKETDQDDEKKKFKKMMFLDGCFILHYMHFMTTDDIETRTKMGMKNHQVAYVKRDLFLLENQLPYIVLEELMSFMPFIEAADKGEKMISDFFKQIRDNVPTTPTSCCDINYHLLDSITRKIKNLRKKPQGSIEQTPPPSPPKSGDGTKALHLLDLLREEFVKHQCGNTDYSVRTTNQNWHSFRSVNELKNSGIRFQVNRNRGFSNVSFAPRRLCFGLLADLTLSPLTVDDSTKSMLLNLAAFEMSPDGPDDFCVTSYICFMDSLLDHAEDVRELRSRNIILNCLGSDQQVADLFNDISTNLVPNITYDNVKSKIEEHYKNRVKIWAAEWVHTHFSSPWTFLAFLGAILAIILTAVQTYFAAQPPTK